MGEAQRERMSMRKEGCSGMLVGDMGKSFMDRSTGPSEENGRAIPTGKYSDPVLELALEP
jgi:hypothetical protein